ncbi:MULTISPECIES: DUF1304 domain-containing protein [Oerskovia]|uniref:DUF1304 domain-containing protein n=1 Tax=Oerskovia TaxID=162491 RepID=UPI0006F24D15|nr:MULTISPECIES: DUF1304 domain-containing protein [unclassified Oerskovia]KRC31699.1 epimerase [Oerskovia sp. Root22]KRD35271.1 epimerase [Oerskovia sp. Root918]
MTATALVFAGLAAVIHVYIFVLESVSWTSPRTRATFGTTEQEAQATRELAFNQGFYNLFLAVITAIGIVVIATGSTGVGAALVLSATGSMVLAGLVLIVSSPAKARAALVQLVPPAIAVVLLVIALVS